MISRIDELTRKIERLSNSADNLSFGMEALAKSIFFMSVAMLTILFASLIVFLRGYV